MRYYVNDRAQTNGDHEVHTAACSFLPSAENRTYLGEHSNCPPAVRKAKQIYPRSNGCFYCARPCHTS